MKPKPQPIQTKRRSTKPKGVRVFYANTKRKKAPAKAANGKNLEMESEVPNLTVSRALLVIALLNVAVIGALMIHNYITKNDTEVMTKDQENLALLDSMSENRMEADLPKVQSGEQSYWVETGDTYRRIAMVKGVSETKLRELNQEIPLKAGIVLRIPSREIAVEESAELARLRANARAGRDVSTDAYLGVTSIDPSSKSDPPLVKVEEEAAPVKINVKQPVTVQAPVVKPKVKKAKPVEAKKTVAVKPKPKLVKPKKVQKVPEIPRAEVVAGRTYKVQAGDTAWRIATRFKVKPALFLKHNGISDPTKLKVGQVLRIP